MVNHRQSDIITILLASVLGLYLCAKLSEAKIIEKFVNVPRTVKVDTLNKSGTSSVSGNNQSELYLKKPPVFTVPGTYQSPIAPRFSNTGYGAYITYNLPEKKNLAVDPTDPMLLASMVEKPRIKESFKYPADSSSTDFQAKYNSLTSPPVSEQPILSELPVQSMSASSGSEVPLVMDRFIVANLKSNLYGAADFIRGDLPIPPILPQSDVFSTTMFRPSVSPQIDLNSGALGVLAGAYNENCRDLVQLQMQSSGGLRDTFSGDRWNNNADTVLGKLQLNMNRSNDIKSSQGPPFGDVSVSMYP
jgi:hypothetical protein